jgi:hypothetical protein
MKEEENNVNFGYKAHTHMSLKNHILLNLDSIIIINY